MSPCPANFFKCREVAGRSYFVVQAGLKLLDSSDLPALASKSAGIAGVSHHVWPLFTLTPSVEFLQSSAQVLKMVFAGTWREDAEVVCCQHILGFYFFAVPLFVVSSNHSPTHLFSLHLPII